MQYFDVDEIDAFVLEDTPLVELPPAKIGPVEEAIGKNCAELIKRRRYSPAWYRSYS